MSMIITGVEHIAPYKLVEISYVYRNYDNDKKDEVDGINIYSVTKESKNDASNAKNKSSIAKIKITTNKNKTIIRK